MKYFIKKLVIVSIILVITLILNSSVFVSNNTITATDILDEEFWQNYSQAERNLQRMYEIFPQNILGESIYICEYGGSYLDDNGNLVIFVVSTSRAKAVATSLGELSETGAIIRLAEHSYAEIMTVLDYLMI